MNKIVLIDFLGLEVKLIEYKKKITKPIILKEYNELLHLYRQFMRDITLNARVVQMLYNNNASELIKQKKWTEISKIFETYDDIRCIWDQIVYKMNRIKEMQNDLS